MEWWMKRSVRVPAGTLTTLFWLEQDSVQRSRTSWIVSLISPSVLGLGTFQRSHDRSGTVSEQWYSATTSLRRTLGLQCCTVQTKWHFSHPQNVCWLLFYVSHHAHLFRNDFWLFRKKLCDSVVRNCSELKSQVFMNGKLAFGRCNTYFNVTFFFMPLYCAMSWVLIRLKYHRDKQCFFYNLLSVCFSFLMPPFNKI